MALKCSKTALLGGLFAGAAMLVAGCGGAQKAEADEQSQAQAIGSGEASAPAETVVPVPQEDPRVVYAEVQTNMGTIVLALDKENAPISTANFVSYAEKRAYDDTIFHRVISDFMIQGGGLEVDLDKRASDAPIKNEWQNGLKNTRGSIAMARLGNEPDSATSQFFINVRDNDFLDTPRDGAGYAVFGRVVDGMAVVDAIRNVPVRSRAGLENVPVDPVIIEAVRVLDAAAAAKYAESAS
ncbi:MAG: peptidylprolyl isomerase [Planctomycetota bacterium]